MYAMERRVNETIWFRFMDEIMNESEKFSNRILDNNIFALKPYDWSDEDDNEWHFYHKPSGLKIQWYKYPLRSPVANMSISHEQFYAVVVDCYNTYWTNVGVIYDYGLAGKWWEDSEHIPNGTIDDKLIRATLSEYAPIEVLADYVLDD